MAPAVRRGIDYLIKTQDSHGSWEESSFTGTGFPRVFYLRYHYYRVYFPLMAHGTLPGRHRAAPRTDRPGPRLPDPGPASFARFLKWQTAPCRLR